MMLRESMTSSKLNKMHKKYSFEYVKQLFISRGYILVSKEYINNRTKLEYICTKGNKHSTTFSGFITSKNCPCFRKNTKLTYDYIKEQFGNKGCTLISTKYVNSTTKLEYICKRGHKHSIKWNDFQQGYGCITCYQKDNVGTGNHNWKGGVSKKLLPLYETYANQLNKYNDVLLIIEGDLNLLGVACTYCGNFYVPTLVTVKNRLEAIHGRAKGDNNFYCSDNCKKACPVFWTQIYPKDFKLVSSREVQPDLRKMVLKRDRYSCQICETSLNEIALHCHHITGIELNPIESADIDNCITLCIDCHKKVHQLPGCNYNDLKCKS